MSFTNHRRIVFRTYSTNNFKILKYQLITESWNTNNVMIKNAEEPTALKKQKQKHWFYLHFKQILKHQEY